MTPIEIPIAAVTLVPVNQLFVFWNLPPKTKAQVELINPLNGQWEVVRSGIENKTGHYQGTNFSVDASLGVLPRLVQV